MNWSLLWVVIAAICGMALSLIPAQLANTQWNWKLFLGAFIPGAMNAAGWAVNQSLNGNLLMNIILAVIGGFGLPTIISVSVALRAANNKIKAMQGVTPKK
jgi:hypothetical protein